MTEMQKNILNFITAFQREHGYSPTLREIGDDVGLSSASSVQYQVHQLAAKGFIRIREGKQRAIQVLQ